MLYGQLPPNAWVYMVDDDLDVRGSMELLVQTLGYATQAYPSAEAFLNGYTPNERQCLILDLHLPGMTGVDLQTELQTRRIDIPVIATTADARGELAVRAKAAGALAVIAKPFRQPTLEPLIQQAIQLSGSHKLK